MRIEGVRKVVTMESPRSSEEGNANSWNRNMRAQGSCLEQALGRSSDVPQARTIISYSEMGFPMGSRRGIWTGMGFCLNGDLGDGLCIVSEGRGNFGARFRLLPGSPNGYCSQPRLESANPGCTCCGARLDASQGVEYDFCRADASVARPYRGRRRLDNDFVILGKRLESASPSLPPAVQPA